MQAFDQLIDLLTRLIADGELTEKQAAAILEYWRDRPTAELLAVLPLVLEVGVGALVEDDDDPPWLPPLLLLGAGSAERTRRMDRLQDDHADEMARLVTELEAARMTVSQWQAAARKANATLLDAAVTLSGGRMTAALQQRMIEIEHEQAAYLQRFADELSLRKLAAPMPEDGRRKALLLLMAWSAAYLANRAASYSGAGRGLFFAGLESGGAESGPGWVIHYQINHDERLCSGCADAEGYYLPGQGPMPGDVCLGGGFCRCERVPMFDEAMYRRLGGA